MPMTALYDAVRNDDQRGIMLEVERLTPDIENYIRKRTGLHPDDVKEVVHCAFIYLMIRIRSGELQPGSGLLKYVQKTAEHKAVKLLRERGRHLSLQDAVGEPAVEYDVLDRLIDEEQAAMIEACIMEFPDDQREFLRFVLERPSYGPEVLADRFGLTVSNATVRKHRLIKSLRGRLRRRYRR